MDGSTLREMASKYNINIRHLKSTVNSDTTLFFIHGSMGSLTMYSSLIEKYEGKVNIVAYDTMGCGLSDKPKLKTEYSTQALTKYAVEIFETFSTTKNVLIGHSYGTAQIARYIYLHIYKYIYICIYIYIYI
jgi:pimeloyl-ACP methyl ester carboxylesterase